MRAASHQTRLNFTTCMMQATNRSKSKMLFELKVCLFLKHLQQLKYFCPALLGKVKQELEAPVVLCSWSTLTAAVVFSSGIIWLLNCLVLSIFLVCYGHILHACPICIAKRYRSFSIVSSVIFYARYCPAQIERETNKQTDIFLPQSSNTLRNNSF